MRFLFKLYTRTFEPLSNFERVSVMSFDKNGKTFTVVHNQVNEKFKTL